MALTKKYPYLLSLIFLVSSPINAANYAGVYVGGFSGPVDNGAFAVLVRSDNTAVIMAYDSVDDFGFIKENITVSGGGTFSESNIDELGSSASGSFTNSSVSGTFNSSGSSGSFSGSKSSFSGAYSDKDGYYKGSYNTTCGAYGSGSGFIRVILSADGNIYAYSQYTQSSIPGISVGSKDGGILSLSGNSISGLTVEGASISGSLNGTTASGSLSFSGCTGSFSATLDYPLTVQDTDGDSVIDSADNCPVTYNPLQENYDGDASGDVCDSDDDDDGLSDTQEAGLGTNPKNDDSDNDGVLDGADKFPLNGSESSDADNDGTGDNADLDDDNDTMPDTYEIANGFDPLNPADASQDADSDGESNLEEYTNGTDPNDPSSSTTAKNRTVLQVINSFLLGE